MDITGLDRNDVMIIQKAKPQNVYHSGIECFVRNRII